MVIVTVIVMITRMVTAMVMMLYSDSNSSSNSESDDDSDGNSDGNILGNGIKKTYILNELRMLIDSNYMTATSLKLNTISFIWRLVGTN